MAYLKMYGGRIVVQPIQITVTLYSAASDTVTFTDDNGSHSVQTNSSGVASNVSIKYTPQTGSAGLVFTSSVAKDPTNLSNAYSKAVPITGDTTEIYVMPDGDICYWYGYNPGLLENASNANGWGSVTYAGDSTFNTNYIQIPTDFGKRSGVGSKNKLSRGTTIHCIGQSLTTDIHGAYVYTAPTKNRDVAYDDFNYHDAPCKFEVSDNKQIVYKYGNATCENYYLAAINLEISNNYKFNMYALWVTS